MPIREPHLECVEVVHPVVPQERAVGRWARGLQREGESGAVSACERRRNRRAAAPPAARSAPSTATPAATAHAASARPHGSRRPPPPAHVECGQLAVAVGEWLADAVGDRAVVARIVDALSRGAARRARRARFEGAGEGTSAQGAACSPAGRWAAPERSSPRLVAAAAAAMQPTCTGGCSAGKPARPASTAGRRTSKVSNSGRTWSSQMPSVTSPKPASPVVSHASTSSSTSRSGRLP